MTGHCPPIVIVEMVQDIKTDTPAVGCPPTLPNSTDEGRRTTGLGAVGDPAPGLALRKAGLSGSLFV